MPLAHKSHILVLPALLMLASAAQASWHPRDWWLPENHAVHGQSIDRLFIWILGITGAVLVAVQAALVWFLIKYRRGRAGRAHHTHGNLKLEITWTVLTLMIMGGIAWASRQVWNEFRYTNVPEDQRARVMVIGEQFKWNVIYPGPDNQLGTYLKYPKVSDPTYRALDEKRATRKINDLLRGDNPLGKDPGDPRGDDDDTENPIRPLVVPVDTTIEVVLGSKDVIHSFFLPNFRVKLDTVPGMTGRVYFLPRKQSTREVPIEQVGLEDWLWVDRDTPGARSDDGKTYYIPDPARPAGRVETFGTLRFLAAGRFDGQPSPQQIAAESKRLIEDLKRTGIANLTMMDRFEIVCEELCGIGHATMRGDLVVVSRRQYDNFIYRNAPDDQRTGRVWSAAGPATRGAP